MIQERARLRGEAEANEIVNRLKHGRPKYMILPDKPFSVEYWITWPPKNEKQTLSKKEEVRAGSGGDNASSSCPICEATKNTTG